jgi:hypothetical protein
MLMGANDGAVEHRVFIIGIGVDGLGALSGWQHDVTDEQCSLAG